MSFRHLIRPRASNRSNPHADWYAQVLPAMFPIALLASTVYLGLQLTQVHLATERRADQYKVRIDQLEQELKALRQNQASPNHSAEPPPRFRRWFFF